jgi:hypothetical protein
LSRAKHLAAAQQHRAPADAFERVRHLEDFENALPGQNLFQQGAQPGYVPLAIAQLIHPAVERLARGDFETFAERLEFDE